MTHFFAEKMWIDNSLKFLHFLSEASQKKESPKDSAVIEMNQKILTLIREFIRERDGFWDEPVISFADARDPLFLKLKKAVDPSHLLPQDLLKGARSVICYFIPFKKEVVLSNEKGRSASRLWAIAYIETNKLISELNVHISQMLKKEGFRAEPIPPTHNFDTEKLISRWSHKHVAYIGGLGKFGLHRMLITEKGASGRIGTVVTDAPFEPTKRKEKEFCLYKNGIECKKCIEKCIFGALREDVFDRKKCYKVCLSNARIYADIGFADVCGKCVSNVPCSFKNPSSGSA